MFKRFLLFSYDCYYPSGGWSDFQSSFDIENEAYDFCLANIRDDVVQIVDTETGYVSTRYKSNDYK